MIDFKNLNKIRFHNRNETTKHLVAKTLVTKILVDKKYYVYTEHLFKKGRVADVFAFKKDEVFIVELESLRSTKKPFENFPVITIYLDDLPDDIGGMYEKLKSII